MNYCKVTEVSVVIVLTLIITVLLSPFIVLAQGNWGEDQIINDNTVWPAFNQQVAMSGNNTVAVWLQGDPPNSGIHSNYSNDGGINWSGDQLIGHSGSLPQVAMSGTNVVAVYLKSDGSNDRVYSNYSSDGGNTWGIDQLIEDNAGHNAFNPQVTISGSNVVAIWYQYDDNGKRIYSNYSKDGGITWNSDQLIEDNVGCHAFRPYPQVAMSGNNTVAVWHQACGGHYRIYSNYSSDGGSTWGSDQLIEDNAEYSGWDPQLAISGLNVVVVWKQSDGSNGRIYSNYSSDGGNTWENDQIIEDNVGYSAFAPQLAISGSNVVAIWCQDDASDNNRIYSNYSSDGGNTWSGSQLIEDNAGRNGHSPQLAISGSNVVAVWVQKDGDKDSVYSNFSTDSGVTWEGDKLIEDNTEHYGHYPQVAISGSNVVAVWGQVEKQWGHPRVYSNCRNDASQIDLNPGWTMISTSLIPYNTDIDAIISSENLASKNSSNIVLIYSFNTTTEQWMWWNGTLAGNLHAIQDGRGYWVYATTADTLTIHGTEAGHPGPDYQVLTGWNLIGFTSETAMTPETYLASVLADSSSLYHWTDAGWNWWMNGNPDSTLINMEPGIGYWLNMSAGGTITPP